MDQLKASSSYPTHENILVKLASVFASAPDVLQMLHFKLVLSTSASHHYYLAVHHRFWWVDLLPRGLPRMAWA